MDKILIIAWNMIRRSIGTFRGLMVFILLPGVVVAAIISLTGGMGEGPATVLYANSDTGSRQTFDYGAGAGRRI
ncbi:hypothetical protein [Paenibacillus rhizoplanae]|uniref:hypothetical protein n=1 Tax=Paenibacillus rhizoplanae TaxID=1917181 RepID=UPI003612B85C